MKTTIVVVVVVILLIMLCTFVRLPNNGQYRGYVYFIREDATCTTVNYKTNLVGPRSSYSTLRNDDPILEKLKDAQKNAQEVYIEFGNHTIGYCPHTVTKVDVINQ